MALALDAAGVSRSVILDDYLATAERMDLIIDRLLSSDTYRTQMLDADRDELTPKPASLERVLELLDERHGGAAGWLLAHGLTDVELDALRRRVGSVDADLAQR